MEGKGKASHSIRAVIFDVDGLLFDTESAIVQVTTKLLEQYGKEFDPNYLEPLGRPPVDAVSLLISHYQLPCTVEEYMAQSRPLLEHEYPRCRAMMGARRLVEHLHAHNIPTAYATSSTNRAISIKRQPHEEWFSLLLGGVTSDDVEKGRGKPQPDLFLKAADVLKEEVEKKRGERELKMEEILVFEDSYNGVNGAFEAGMPCVAVPSHPMKTEEKKAIEKEQFKNATIMISHLLTFDPTLFGLPPFADVKVLPDGTSAIPISPPITIDAPTVSGFGRGSNLLKIPTANVDANAVAKAVSLNLSGVFFGYVVVESKGEENENKDGLDSIQKTVMSIGWNPHFGNTWKTLEPHIMYNYGRPLYGHNLKMVINGFLRDEIKYDSLEALIADIKLDIEHAITHLDMPPFADDKQHPLIAKFGSNC
eukprot:CAMPEP_0113897728 /NCGR_PEP_ID=MMETSP0780_2-20120614/18897_1 /TAXON_ID=652834 /ORGANISM="Palpitomonas bilix" /LENGTH=421 /DNA_ID=CAMNT_0000889337 /DNA_START=3 /DNA_END=1268 /DNA_ORIENTATION=- /assembly_acc=CAM_ASM_000599